MLQARGELDHVGEPGIVGPREQLLQVTHHGGTRLLERTRVVRLHRGAELRQLIERRGHQHRTGQALERGGGRDLHGGMVVTQQAEHPADVVRRSGNGKEARALEPLPPARRPAVGA